MHPLTAAQPVYSDLLQVYLIPSSWLVENTPCIGLIDAQYFVLHTCQVLHTVMTAMGLLFRGYWDKLSWAGWGAGMAMYLYVVESNVQSNTAPGLGCVVTDTQPCLACLWCC